MDQAIPPRQTNPLPVKIIAYDGRTGKATAIEEDGVEYDVWLPLFFGGRAAPYPEVGDTIMIRWDRCHKRVSEAYHSHAENRYEAPVASLL